MHRDLGSCTVDLSEIAGCEFDCNGSDVLVQATQLRGAWDWNDPRLLGQQPRQGDLSGRRLLPLADLAEQINQGLIRLERLRCEAREGAEKVVTVEGRFLIQLSREKTLAQRAVRNEADAEFFERRYHFLLGGSCPQRIFALESSKRLAEGSEGFAHKLFVQERAVNLGRVEERDAAFRGCPQNGTHLPALFEFSFGEDVSQSD